MTRTQRAITILSVVTTMLGASNRPGMAESREMPPVCNPAIYTGAEEYGFCRVPGDWYEYGDWDPWGDDALCDGFLPTQNLINYCSWQANNINSTCASHPAWNNGSAGYVGDTGADCRFDDGANCPFGGGESQTNRDWIYCSFYYYVVE